MNQLLSAMIVLAAQRHDGKFDKAGKPYILHTLKVMHYLNTDDIELQIIAIGHDLIEDTKTTYEELRNMGFTERVINGIRCLTKQPGQTQEEYVEIIKSNPDAIKVKLADLRHNSDIRRLKGLTQKDFDRMAKYHKMFIELREYQFYQVE